MFTIIDYLSLGVLTSNQVAVKSNLHIAPTSNTIIPPTSRSAFQKWDTTRYTYCPSFMNVLCDRLNILGHWLPLLSHAWHVIPVSGNFISIVILDCVAKMETYARAAKHVAGYIIQIHPTLPLLYLYPPPRLHWSKDQNFCQRYLSSWQCTGDDGIRSKN